MAQVRTLGHFTAPAVGLGCMPLSEMPPVNNWMLDQRESAIPTIYAVLVAVVTVLETADTAIKA